MNKTERVGWTSDPRLRLLWVILMPRAHPDQQNQSLGISNFQVSQVTGICGPGRESVSPSILIRGGVGWPERSLREDTFDQGTGSKGRATKRAGGRIFWKGTFEGQGGRQLGFS